MAEKHTVPGVGIEVKPVNPVSVGFLSLTIVYIPFFWYRINKELKQLGEARGIDLGTSPGAVDRRLVSGRVRARAAVLDDLHDRGAHQERADGDGAQGLVGGLDRARGPVPAAAARVR